MALVVAGDAQQADLYALDANGVTRVLFSSVGDQVNVSPAGNWLGFVRWGQDGHATLELYDAQGDTSRHVTPDTTSGSLRFAFDPPGRRLAYLDLGAPDATGVPWALVVVDLESGAESRYEALMTDGETRPLPGAPIGWASAAPGDEVLLDTFFPYSEGGWQGVWGVTLRPGDTSAPFDTLPLRELIPGAAYASELYFAPQGQTLAFLGRDPDYFPTNYFPEFYDLAVNRLQIAAVADGARTTLVEATDGSALGRALAWSPAGERLLFAQGNYEGESFAALSLKSSDLGGAVVEYGPLTLPPLGGLLDLAWCQEALALYVTWDGSDGTQRLFRFDLASALSSELLAAQRVEIVGCAP
jgi:dipeptidyl aminopeptidase/acylaminoacyl peptidase